MSSRTLTRTARWGAAVAALSLLAACGNSGSPAAQDTAPASAAAEVKITDNHGEITVPVKPKTLVALDNSVMQTLVDWKIDLAAAPKGVIGDVWPSISDNANIKDVGSHNEPKLEAIIEASPDLIIGGMRFQKQYGELKKIQPTTIEISRREGQPLAAEQKRQVLILGQIFDREEEAKKLSNDLDKAIADAKAAYDGKSTVVGIVASGGKLAYAAPGDGRSVGPLFPELGLKAGIDKKAGEDASHGEDIGVEAIAQANPDWLIVLDRDGAFQEDGYVAAKELIEGTAALKNVTAVKKKQIIYLDANFYLDEGIQSYTKLYQQVAKAFSEAS